MHTILNNPVCISVKFYELYERVKIHNSIKYPLAGLGEEFLLFTINWFILDLYLDLCVICIYVFLMQYYTYTDKHPYHTNTIDHYHYPPLIFIIVSNLGLSDHRLITTMSVLSLTGLLHDYMSTTSFNTALWWLHAIGQCTKSRTFTL